MMAHAIRAYLRVLLYVALFGCGFALLGAEGWGGHWRGYVAGGVVGVVFGLVFAGVRGPWVDWLFPPADEAGEVKVEHVFKFKQK